MRFDQLLVFTCVLVLACVNGNDQALETKPTLDSAIKDSIRSSKISTQSITNKNFWQYNNQLNELMDTDDSAKRYKLALRIDSSQISEENRLAFYLKFYFILMENEDYGRALRVLKTRYVDNPMPELSNDENLYMYYFWGTVIKLQSSECDSAIFYYNQLENLSDNFLNMSPTRVDSEKFSLKKILDESCM